MARGSKEAYTDKQRRRADHIAEGYREHGVSGEEAERRAWATVNKESGSGRGRMEKRSASREGGRARAASTRKRAAAGRTGAGRRTTSRRGARKAARG